jgi:hypothetical protein
MVRIAIQYGAAVLKSKLLDSPENCWTDWRKYSYYLIADI